MLGPDDRRRAEIEETEMTEKADPAASFHPVSPWSYPVERYYYPWALAEYIANPEPSDHSIKSTVVQRLKENPHTKDDTIKVDVKQRVVILGGEVSSWLAKRAAGDDAWDTAGVVDVSNQLHTPEQPRP
ncbi:BON domain-containing protein [Tenggerimyces flavus]|uniref:BON domain-containing protein n=1 Tax=Tenggerimyces flavus TaxID=1708749 RepID=A0ABV7YJV3_9ACTN|nr:BON domain-containing protein [Tenggerimyces flavus]MBM7784701.1 hypothetical protein [Tenggerimyces flavus]